MPFNEFQRERAQIKILAKIHEFVSCLYDPDDLSTARWEIQETEQLMHRILDDAEWADYRTHGKAT